MKAHDHLGKAEEIRQSIEELLRDGDRHVSSIVELAFGLMHHLIAYGLENKYGEHRDVHYGIPALLRKKDEDSIAVLFERLTSLRHGRWYGGKGNGEVVREAMKIIGKIERWCKE
ncbi:MAG: hypothetical protein KAW84_04510 [Thermoplasmata archaeon]|nr:hypothetical protein [Thermoplasmata archaeon]